MLHHRVRLAGACGCSYREEEAPSLVIPCSGVADAALVRNEDRGNPSVPCNKWQKMCLFQKDWLAGLGGVPLFIFGSGSENNVAEPAHQVFY